MQNSRPNSNQNKRIALGAPSILIALVLWQILSLLGLVNSRIFPSPIQVASALISMLLDGRLITDVAVSLFRALTGFVIGSITAISFGLMTGRSEKLRQSVGQIINILRPIPAISIVPLVIVWFGLGEAAKVLTVCWGVFFPVWVSTHVGVASVNIEHIWAAQSLGAKRKTILLEIVLPGAATSILAGMRTGISIAFICLVAAEMAGASAGLGFRVTVSHLTFRVDQMIASIFVLGLLGAIADKTFVKLSHKLFPWYARSQKIYVGD